ncbi:MAG: hypothetical protein QOJ38_196 [Solirubrobacterales bacterium]|nr:hypothetical protein [Solirubrobacterales bacterium]
MALALAAAVAAGVFYDGGFSPASRTVFGCLALAALASTAVAMPADVRAFAREPVVLVLWGLGLLGALSAAWAVGFAADSLRWGLVCAGYGALVIVAATLGRRPRGAQEIAVGIAALAAVAGLIGLAAAALFAEPLADRIGGSWRPGGPLEYSSALALLEVSALPVLLRAMCTPRRSIASLGALAAAVAAAVLALAASREEIAFAALLGALALALPRACARADRRSVLAALLLLVAAGAAAQLVAGGYVAPRHHGSGAGRLLGLALVLAAAPAVWLGLRAVAGAGRRLPIALGLLAVVSLVAALPLAFGPPAEGAGQTDAQRRHGIEASAGLLHGRPATWGAALETFADRPLYGAGADSFLAASARHQDHGPVRFAHNLPFELAAELGLAGAALALALYAGAARLLWRARGTPAAWLLGPAVVGFLAANLVDWPWHLAGSGAVWAIALGGLLGCSRATGPASG